MKNKKINQTQKLYQKKMIQILQHNIKRYLDFGCEREINLYTIKQISQAKIFLYFN